MGKKGKGAANAIRNQLVDLHPYIKKLQGLDITTINFDTNVFVDGKKITISQAVEKCYKDLRKNVKHRFAATATSKLLHILQPKLFVMWDRKIRDDFHDKNSQVLDSAKGYGTFLQLMQKKATDVCNAFNKRYPRQKRDPAKFLSDNLKYNPPQTFARFLDEYNWITITKGCSIPPPWHPPKLSRKYGGRRRKR
jgi:hypothetical protein